MKVIACILFLLNPLTITFGQTITSQIRDSKTNAPIAYATIGIVGKNLGTVSDSYGNFQMSLIHTLNTDTIRISIIGYIPKEYRIENLRNRTLPAIIYMDTEVIYLTEAVISNKTKEVFQIGLKQKYCYPIPLFRGAKSKVAFPQKNVQYEIGTRFTNSKKINLDSIQINIAECNVDLVALRINIYTIDGDVIENILQRPIYVSLTKSTALNSPIINVTTHSIKISSDFLIALENYQQLKDGAIYLFANFKRKGKLYPTYYRDGTQSNWIPLQNEKSKPIALSILAFSH